jgi:endonuclease I
MRLFSLLFLLITSITVGQIPSGYYDAAQGLYGENLRTALKTISANGHVKLPYTSTSFDVWDAYQFTDVRSAPNNTIIWDMYSDVPNSSPAYTFTIFTNQCGTSGAEGDCYSREHCLPNSYWGGFDNAANPQYTDLHHLFPADQYVNNKKSNYPIGYVNPASVNYTSSNGSKVGACGWPGYTGLVFEPINEYKGDFARAYLYMITRYMDQITTWRTNYPTTFFVNITNGNNYAPWYIDMLVSWSDNDPVSAKEIARNNAIYYQTPQHNRNPFIDHPEYVRDIWKTVVWNGTTWSNSVGSNSSLDAVIDGNYTLSTDFTAYDLTINSAKTVNVTSGYKLTVVNRIENNGTITVQNNANVVQTNNVQNTGNGNAYVFRNSASLMRLDYTLWSSPVASQNLLSFSPNTLSNRFYTYNPNTNFYEVVSSPSTTNFEIGKGYLIRMPNNHPSIPTIWNGTFSGNFNNGTITNTVTANTYNVIGNPYPSTISADAFIDENALTEPLYFWRKTNNTAQTSYATYTKAGGTGTTAANLGDPLNLIPNGTIQVGQGFIVKATGNTIKFNNSMRTANFSNQFLRQGEEKSRFWLNITDNQGEFYQTMVAYMSEATSDVDFSIDGKYIDEVPLSLNSKINDEAYVIQGRGTPFTTSDIVPLIFSTNTSGNFTISIDHVDGLFAEGQAIYLKDKTANNIHNLNEGSYSFYASTGNYSDRFEIVYQETLNVSSHYFTSDQIIVYHNNRDIIINSAAVNMDQIRIFDISGRLLFEQSNMNTNTIRLINNYPHEVLLIEIKAITGEIVTKKIGN